MKGLILNNAFMDTPATRYQSARLKEELEKLGVEADIAKNNFFCARIADGELENAVTCYDFCIFFDKDKYSSYALERQGLRLFNSHEAVLVCDDKVMTALALAGHGIPMPKTIAGLMCFDGSGGLSEDNLALLEGELGYPMIVKGSYGSLGKAVFKADGRQQLLKLYSGLADKPHLFQQFIGESSGRDIRVIVIGGRVFAAMDRVSPNDFRSNIGLGGKGYARKPDGELISLCERTADILGLDYCGIDILEGKSGYLVCEVNSNAFFGGIEAATHKNVAKAYAEHIVKTMKL